MRRSRLLLLALAAGHLGYGQTQLHLQTQAKAVDFSNSNSTRPVKTGTILPAVCSLGELFFKQNAAPGQNLYGCTAANVWSVLTGVAYAALGASEPACNTASAGTFFVNTSVNPWTSEVCGKNESGNYAWSALLSTEGVGQFLMTGQTGSTPSSPSTGSITQWFDSADKLPKAMDDAGAVSVMVRPKTAAAHQFVTAIGTDGTVGLGQPSAADVSGLAYQAILDNGTARTQRPSLNFIAGSNIALTLADDASNNRTNVTVATTGGTGALAETITPLLPGDWTVLNSASAFHVVSGGGRILMARDSGDSANLLVRGVYHAVPPTPYTRTFVVDYSQGYKSSQGGGVGWGDDSGKIVSCKNMVYDAGGIGMGGEYHDASGGIQSGPLVPVVYSGKMGLQVFRLSDNGSTRTCEWSMDGMNFLTIFSEANTNYLTPTRLIAMLTPGAASGQPSLLNFISYR